ncbi:hypothetical protein SLEP1_g55121 [Rubroshorea leprosula]|uniref:Uncharacterized protein n=1 Tax=Rubroshorea leprosula TaxID=152421 RepID=A0AAV5MIK5_9ROSI|nr:hypothetical protein SLEP1_g55121 [Rubroshorea leprosula]
MVLLWEKVIDQYCGPDRITAKKQQEKLEKVAKNIPNNAPASVKQSANRSVLSLQSNLVEDLTRNSNSWISLHESEQQSLEYKQDVKHDHNMR